MSYRGKMDRRRFLRGAVAGTTAAVALPLLPSLFGNDRAFAQALEKVRFMGIYQANGFIEEDWYPERGSSSQRNFSLQGTALEPLEPHKANITLLRSMRCAGVESGGGNGHMRAIAGFFTGAGIPNDRISRFRISMDQLIADEYEKTAPTRIHSMQLIGNPELDPPNNSQYTNALKNAVSFDSEGRMLPNTANLRAQFNLMFPNGLGTGAPEEGQGPGYQKSVLDLVASERQAFMANVGMDEREIVDQYFESVRDAEKQISTLPTVSCDSAPNTTFPSNDDKSRMNELGDHMRAVAKLVTLGFQCGITRVATYAFSGEASGCHYRDIKDMSINEHIHNSISHNRGAKKGKHHRVDKFHVELVANMLSEFEAVRLGNGTLMDNTAVVFGTGLGNADSHNHRDIALLIAGRFGNIKQGAYHMDLNNRFHYELLSTVLENMGFDPRFGANTGGKTLDLTV